MELKGVIGFGGKVTGLVISVDDQNGDFAGKIVIGGDLVLGETIEKAKATGALGLICKGINYRDFCRAEKLDKDFPLIVLGGFGSQKILTKMPTDTATLDGQKLTITW